MPVTVAVPSAMPVLVLVPTIVVIPTTPVPIATVITVTTTAPAITAVVVAHEIHRLAARTVLAAIARPVPGVAGWHTHVDGALVHGHRGLLDDDRLGVDQRGLLLTDVDTAIKTRLRHADADANIGGTGQRTLAAQGSQTEDAKSATKGAVKRELMR